MYYIRLPLRLRRLADRIAGKIGVSNRGEERTETFAIDATDQPDSINIDAHQASGESEGEPDQSRSETPETQADFGASAI